jgi:hypothetical protein
MMCFKPLKHHEAIAAASSTGVNIITGEGLAEVLAGAEVVIEVANSPSFEDRSSIETLRCGRGVSRIKLSGELIIK